MNGQNVQDAAAKVRNGPCAAVVVGKVRAGADREIRRLHGTMGYLVPLVWSADLQSRVRS